jgi:acyl carrier protein
MTQQFIEILNRVKPDILENSGIDLVEDGILDSLDVMRLVAELEQTFEFDFDSDDLSPENFASAEALWVLVNRYVQDKTNG